MLSLSRPGPRHETMLSHGTAALMEQTGSPIGMVNDPARVSLMLAFPLPYCIYVQLQSSQPSADLLGQAYI